MRIVGGRLRGRTLQGPKSSAVRPTADRLRESLFDILADGGVRSGLDVVRMLALGADFVLLGRAWAYALAAGGQGVAHMLRLVEAEIRVAMALTGSTKVADLGPEFIDEHA